MLYMPWLNNIIWTRNFHTCDAQRLFLEQGFHEELLGLPPHLQDWYKRGKRLLVSPKDNMSLFSIAEGKGPETLLLLHAMPSSSHDYHRVLPLITEEFRVVMFDLPGFGFSDKPKQVLFKGQCFQIKFWAGKFFSTTELHILCPQPSRDDFVPHKKARSWLCPCGGIWYVCSPSGGDSGQEGQGSLAWEI